MTAPLTGAVLIGRNEGDRLARSLASVQGRVAHMIYVDSGSTDDSLAVARTAGAEVVELDMTLPFTAARARNAGLERLCQCAADATLVQFLDGDCALDPGWLPTAQSFLAQAPDVAVVFGRRRELAPEKSLYNRLIDQEWDTPLGQSKACGGDALMRVAPLRDIGAFNETLIAGEEPEMCVRLRQAGWKIWRIDAEMTLHDADLTRFSQWWQRSKRGGHAYAEGAALHGALPERHKRRELRSAVVWGAALPLLAVIGLLFSPLGVLVLLLYPLQMLRLWYRGLPGLDAIFVVLAKLPEAQGALLYWRRRLRGRHSQLIEYK